MNLVDIIQKYKKTNKDAKLLVLGLDNAGKTTLLKFLSSEPMKITEPTKGFNVKTLMLDGFKLNVWDLGGQEAIRKYWPYYFDGTHGIV
jgi:small GTP-binding protein